MKPIKVGLNGFGRIGRSFARIALQRGSFDLSVVNTRKTTNEMLAYLLQNDSVYRRFEMEVKSAPDGFLVNDKKIATTQFTSPEETPWDKFQIDLVIDATGAFTKKADLEKHLKGSVKKVILTAPSKDEEIPHVVLGVNDKQINWGNEAVISNASCTTNCAAPMFKILDNNFKIVSGFLTTIHALTMTQSMLDDAEKTFDRSRAAFLNISPSTSGAARAVVKALPQLKGKIEVGAIRVPVATVSLSDISVLVEKKITIDGVNTVFKKAAKNELKGIIDYQTEVLVSSDYIGSPYSCIYDANYTKVINEDLIKVYGWYDNEWGYSARLVDLVEKISDYV